MPQRRAHRSPFGTKRLMSHLAFDTLKSELSPLVNTLPKPFLGRFPSLTVPLHKTSQAVNHHLWTEVQLSVHIFHIVSAT